MDKQIEKILALDVGEKFIGLAVAFMEDNLVLPKKALRYDQSSVDILIKMLVDEKIDLLVVGLPLNSDLSENDQSKFTKKFVEKIRKKLESSSTQLLIEYENEYGSTKEAKQRFKIESSNKAAFKKEAIDSTSASIILESYIARTKLKK